MVIDLVLFLVTLCLFLAGFWAYNLRRWKPELIIVATAGVLCGLGFGHAVHRGSIFWVVLWFAEFSYYAYVTFRILRRGRRRVVR